MVQELTQKLEDRELSAKKTSSPAALLQQNNQKVTQEALEELERQARDVHEKLSIGWVEVQQVRASQSDISSKSVPLPLKTLQWHLTSQG